MTPRDRMILGTLCLTLAIAVVGIVVLMLCGRNVSAPVSLAVAGEWGALLAVYAKGDRE